MNLKVKLGKIVLDNPVICASGTFGIADELKGLADYSKIGAVIAKTITLKPRKGNLPPRIYECAHGVINAVGLENPGLESFIKINLPVFGRLPARRIVSIGGFSAPEYLTCLKELEKHEKSIDGFEINLSCPNISLKRMISQSPADTHKLLKKLRALTKKTIIAKLTPEVTDIEKIAQAAEEAGADALSLVNTFFGLAIDVETRRPYLGNIYGGYSGPAIKPMALYRVFRAAGAVSIPVIGGGGIKSTRDAVEFILAGATAISLGTINLSEPCRPQEIASGLKDFLKERKIRDINSIRGGVIGK